MTLAIKITFALALILGIVLPYAYYFLGEKARGRYKKALVGNVLLFFGCMLVASVLTVTEIPALADVEETAEAAASSAAGWAYIAAALSVGLACIGGGVAVASAASAALGAISEDSSVFGKSLIYIGLAEGVCLYGTIIAFMILGQV